MSKLMDYINNKILDDEIKDDDKLENKQVKLKLKTTRAKLNDAIKELEYIKDKYLALLEEKGESFNQYIYWQNKANEYELDIKETKKDLLDFKKDFKDFEFVVGKYFTRDIVTSLAKCENYDDFMTYVLGLYFNEKELPSGITDVCKKLEITKSVIRKESNYVYDLLGVDKWDIEE